MVLTTQKWGPYKTTKFIDGPYSTNLWYLQNNNVVLHKLEINLDLGRYILIQFHVTIIK